MYPPTVPVSSRTRAAIDRRNKENHRRLRSTSSMFSEQSSRKGFFKKSRANKNHHRSLRSDSPPPENIINLVDDDLPPRRGRGKKEVASQSDTYWRGKEKIVIDDAPRREKKVVVTPSEDNWKGKLKIVVDDSSDYSNSDSDSDSDEEDDDEIYVTVPTTSSDNNGFHIQSPIVVSSSDVEYEDSELSTDFGLTSSSDSAEETGSDPEFRPDEKEDEIVKELSVDEVLTTSSTGESRSFSHDSGSSTSRLKKVESLSLSSRSRKPVSPKRKRERQEVVWKQKSPEVECSSSSTDDSRKRRTTTSAKIGRKVQKYSRIGGDVSSEKEVERGVATLVHEGSVFSSSSRGTRKRKTSAEGIGNTVQYSREQTISGKEVAHEGSVSCSCQTPSKKKKISAQESISVKEVEKEQLQQTHEISVSTSVQSKSKNAERKEKESVDEKAKKAAKTTTTTIPGSSQCVAHRTRSHEPNKNENLKNLGFDSSPITLDGEDRINSFQDQQRSTGVDLQRETRIKRQTTLVDDAQEKGENVGLDVREGIRRRHKKEKETVAVSVEDEREEETPVALPDDHDDSSTDTKEREEEKHDTKETEAETDERVNDNSETERLKKLAKKKLSEAATKLSPVEINKLLAHFMTLNEENGFLEKLYEEEKRRLSLLYGGRLFEDKVVPERPVDEFHALWMEMEMCMAAEEIGSTDSCVIDEDALSSSPEIVDQRQLCEEGKHQLVLEEQIGLVCKFCSFIETEIQHVTAPFHTNPFGVSSSRRRYRYSTTGQDPASPNQEPGNLFVDPLDSTGTDEDDVYIPTGEVWDLIPGLKKGMYEHQIEGFEFMWRNISGRGTIRLSKLPKKHNKLDCGGCIMSHAPGTGKTRLAISFLESYLKLYKDSRPVIIAPCGMLLTWAKEFKTWKVDVPFHNLNDHLPSHEEFKPYLWLLAKCRNQKAGMSNTVRLVKLQSWLKGGSVLGISYKLFEQLVGDVSDESRRKKTSATNFVEQKIREALVKHSGLLVLDEGHTPRNEASKIFQALCKVETNKRIILSGTPFQNNLVELYNTLCLVQPHFPETLPVEDRGIFTQRKGGKRDEDKAQSAIPKDKLRLLRARIKPFVHIHKGAILLEKLPGLSECALDLKPSDWQKELFSKAEQIPCFMESDYLLSLLSVHPSLICDDEKPEAAAEAHKSAISNESTRTKLFNALPLKDRKRLKHHKSEPWVGLKANFVIELVRLCSKIKERVLVFSQFIEPLEYLNGALCSIFNWKEGVQIHCMHGKMGNKKRQHVMDEYNDLSSEAKVLLASTKACSEGIKLVGASRVVLLDVVWNPSVERQAISRAYRIGQEKRVYVYHLIASGTNEVDKYSRQIQKDRVSKLLFWKGKEEGEGKRKLEGKGNTAVTDDAVLDMMVRNEKVIFSKRSLG